MKKDEHYGKIPGCGDKPTLLLPGAQKLLLTFRLAPEFYGEENPRDLGKNHREYIIKCRLKHINTGAFWGEGVGSCSTMESKYRYRNEYIDTGDPIPQDYRDNKAKYKADGFVCRKDNGNWRWYQYKKTENDNPADVYNTVLKMAKKRALVDAVLTATAASDIFTQDLEDLKTVIAEYEEIPEQPQPEKKKDVQKKNNHVEEKEYDKLFNELLERINKYHESGRMSDGIKTTWLDNIEKASSLKRLQTIEESLNTSFETRLNK